MPRKRAFVVGTLMVSLGVLIAIASYRMAVRESRLSKTAKNPKALAGSLPEKTTAESRDLSEGPKWGHLRGRFVFVGKPPEPKRLVAAKGTPTCEEALYDESLIVGSDGGLANVFVWLVTEDLARPLAVHPSYEKNAGGKVEFKFQHCRLFPHAHLLWTTQTLLEDNQDKISHDPKLGLWSNAPS